MKMHSILGISYDSRASLHNIELFIDTFAFKCNIFLLSTSLQETVFVSVTMAENSSSSSAGQLGNTHLALSLPFDDKYSYTWQGKQREGAAELKKTNANATKYEKTQVH